jgi:hypothetical protein
MSLSLQTPSRLTPVAKQRVEHRDPHPGRRRTSRELEHIRSSALASRRTIEVDTLLHVSKSANADNHFALVRGHSRRDRHYAGGCSLIFGDKKNAKIFRQAPLGRTTREPRSNPASRSHCQYHEHRITTGE